MRIILYERRKMMYNDSRIKWKEYGDMYCLRCGNETTNEQVFCEKCLSNMERYPVKPGTPIKIPHRNTVTAVKKQGRRKALTPEEQVIRLKVHLRTLLALFGTAIILMGIFAYLYFQEINKKPAENTQEQESAYTAVQTKF